MTAEQAFRSSFKAMERGPEGADDFLAFYDDEVTFEDPAQRVHGREALGVSKSVPIVPAQFGADACLVGAGLAGLDAAR